VDVAEARHNEAAFRFDDDRAVGQRLSGELYGANYAVADQYVVFRKNGPAVHRQNRAPSDNSPLTGNSSFEQVKCATI
jgi:hypothetical protein